MREYEYRLILILKAYLGYDRNIDSRDSMRYDAFFDSSS